MSATPEPPVPLSALRQSLRRAVAASSLRDVASAVGMTHRGLTKFLEGSKPQAATLRKLLRWYLSHSAGAFLDADTGAAALEVLVSAYPEREQEKVRAELLEVLREGHRKAGTKPPEWLK